LALAARAGLDGFESELGMNSSSSLPRILGREGYRGQEFKTETKETHNHDSDWHYTGGAGWSVFGGNVGGGQEQRFKQSMEHLESIKIEADYLDEVWVVRRDWFSSPVLRNKYVIAELKRDPRSAGLLANCMSALIISRGLKITYKFKDQVDTQVWSNWNYKQSGGFSVFGLRFNDEGGASGSQYDRTINTVEKSVTFHDGPQVCRLLAARVSSLLKNVGQGQIAFETRPLEESDIGQRLIEAWKSGEVPYGETPQSIESLRLLNE
jgi:hypothetical protein